MFVRVRSSLDVKTICAGAALVLGASFSAFANQVPQKLALIDSESQSTSKDPKIAKPETKHITLVLVGDTGYAPHRATPHPKGVSKHGRWLTYEQTTKLIASEINGDINFANMESVITDRRLRAVPKAFNFATHSNGARHLVETGFNLFSMANNHSFDHGKAGIFDSVRYADELKKDGLLAHAGIGRNRENAAKTPVFSVKGANFSLGAIGIGAGSGGIQRATAKRPGQLSLYSKADLSLLANNLAGAKADFRLLSIHRGPERYIRPSKGEIRSVRSLVKASNADIMIGHHAHVTRGIEVMDDRLIVYGLGNFLHHGTANMAGKNGCLDYSIMARVHLVQEIDKKPKIAAVEVLPITQTHMQTKRLGPRQSAKRIAVLNGLARQFDNSASNSRGVRFGIRPDGSGLYCTQSASKNAVTSNLCKNYAPQVASFKNTYSRALRSCGSINPTSLLASMAGPPLPTVLALNARPASSLPKPQSRPKTEENQKVAVSQPIQQPVLRGALAEDRGVPDPIEDASKSIISVTVPAQLKQNPETWPKGMPLAWRVPANETYKQKRRRWLKKRFSIAEVEKLLIKRGLLSQTDRTKAADLSR